MTSEFDPAPNRVTGTRPLRGLWIELAIVAALVVGSGAWATHFWNTWTARGGQPHFYQTMFEPAVMVACGHGFVIGDHQPKPLEDFLYERADRFDCRDLTPDLKFRREGFDQQAWIYLETTVGLAWRVLGISWSGMGPFYGLLFGIVVALAYGIFRLGMARPWAVVCVVGLAISSTHLLNLPGLRDYAKAPFTLALVVILGLLVTQPVRRWSVLGLAATYGAVLGFGYGFRTDLLASLPVFPLVAFAFLGGGVTRNLRLKTAAVALCFTMFAFASWPVLSAVYRNGGCQWHFVLLGLQAPHDNALQVSPAPYDFGHVYSDAYIDRVVRGYADRMHPANEPLTFCSHDYDLQSGGYAQSILASFPGDFIVRAYASALRIVELPFLEPAPPMTNWMTPLYAARQWLLLSRQGWGPGFALAAVLMAGAASLRLGLFLLFFVSYFGGYPAIQFQPRHYFHLEFMAWWSFGFVCHQTMRTAWSAWHARPSAKRIGAGLVRASACVLVAVVTFASLLGSARWYQGRKVRQLMHAYIEAPKALVQAPDSPLPNVGSREWPQYLEVDLDEAACGARPAVTFRDTPVPTGLDFTRTITIARHAPAPGLTRILLPVFEAYRGLELSDTRPGCFAGAYRFTNTEGFPLLLGAALPPDWETLRLYQRLKEWELDPRPASAPLTFSDMPAPLTWTRASGVSVRRTFFGDAVFVGDRSASGYQVSSTPIHAAAGSHVTVQADLSVSRGHVCLGALNATGSAWLAPASGARREVSFTADASGGFIVTLANCNSTEMATPTRFKLSKGRYAIVDRDAR